MQKVFTKRLLPYRQIESYSILHLGERKVFLNPSGTRIWNLIDGVKTDNEIALTVANEINAPAEKVTGKVTAFIDHLYQRGLLWLADNGSFKGVSIESTASAEALADADVSAPPPTAPRPAQEVCMTPKFEAGAAASVEQQLNQLYWQKHDIQKMHIELTYRCNFRCVLCYNTTHGGAAT